MPTKSVLVVDDDSSMREFLNEVLSRHGMRVTTAVSGQHALGVLKTNQKFDLIITDFVMPGMDGIGLLASVRSDENLKEVPVMMITGSLHPSFLPDLAALDISGLLLKPIVETTLKQKIEKILGRNAGRVA